ncbi:MAG: hypothetical protein K0Q60_3820 [Microvirga sp.]|jgi:hypothetical protein|nr:hypothetical protein [Microvirga sp.]
MSKGLRQVMKMFGHRELIPRGRKAGVKRIGVGLGLGGAIATLALSAGSRARSGRSPAKDASAGGQRPDVLLDVSELEVERINLEVEALRAHVSILAELGGLLNLSVGVDARLNGVKLEIEGVRAKAILKARLEHVRAILEKALDTIAENPEILRIVSESLGAVVRESLEGAEATLSEVLEGLKVGDAVDEALIGRLEEIRAIHEDLLGREEAGTARRALPRDSSNDTASSA